MTKATRLAPLLSVFALALGGCLASSSDIDGEDVGQRDDALAMSAANGARVLDLVNYPGTDEGMLDEEIGLDSRAAKGIIAHRNGPDGEPFTADDNLFDDIAELDAIPYVTDSAFSKLEAYAAAHPVPAAESVEGVSFKGWEAEAVIWGVNQGDVAELDGEVGLDVRAARGLVARVPFASVTAMGPVSYVGTSALQHLKAHAAAWWNEAHSVASPGVCASNLAEDLAPVIQDLWYLSESDYPFTNFAIVSGTHGTISAAEVAGALVLPAGTHTEVWSVDRFFGAEWMQEEGYAEKYAAMRQILSSELTDLTVVRTGTIQISVFIVGRTACGQIAGLRTVAIET